MEGIDSFLKKINDIVLKNRAINSDILNVIEKTTNLKISIREIFIKGSVIFLKINPSKKSLIFIKKRKILEEIKNNTNILISDIR